MGEHFLFKMACILVSCSYFSTSYAQSGMWTWIKGSNTTAYLGSYGIKGIPDPSNNPPALYEPAWWTDLEGNFWLFGGQGPNGLYSALWRYKPETNKWTWMKGPSTPNEPGIYGVQGVPSPNNKPGARSYGMLTWTDTEGKLWMFGGAGFGSSGSPIALSDLWKYDIDTHEWTWMGGLGQTSGPYAVAKQVFSPLNNPGSIHESGVKWVDEDGNFWFFGGEISFSYYYNLVWKYDVGINQWAWMAGDYDPNPSNNYGVPGEYGASTQPGGRRSYGSFMNEDKKVLFFGGNIDDTYLDGHSYADLWQFDPDLLLWMWKDGSDIPDYPGYYGTKCDTSKNFVPAARMENTMRWLDDCGNFWMYGGLNDPDELEELNDLWVYNPETNLWSFVSGNTQPGGYLPVYGSIGIPDVTNSPGGRYGAASWKDKEGRFYFFGGRNWYTHFGDLWRYETDTLCPAPLACKPPAFLVSDKNVCEKFCIDFSDQSTNAPNSWLWHFQGGAPSTSTDQNPVNICYNNPGNFDVTLITSGTSGIDTVTYTGLIHVHATPDVPVITKAGDILTSSPAITYQWQLDFINIPGATTQTYIATQDGFYTVLVFNEFACTAYASIAVEVTGIAQIDDQPIISIYPNPGSGKYYFSSKQLSEKLELKIYDNHSRCIFEKYFEKTNSEVKEVIDISNQPAGFYFLEIKSSVSWRHQKLVIVK